MSPGMTSILTQAMIKDLVFMDPEVGPVGSSYQIEWRSLLFAAELQTVDAKASPQGNGAASDGQ